MGPRRAIRCPAYIHVSTLHLPSYKTLLAEAGSRPSRRVVQPGSGEYLRIDRSLRIPVVVLEKLLRALLIHLGDRDEVGGRLTLRRVWHRADQSQLRVDELGEGEDVLSQ